MALRILPIRSDVRRKQTWRVFISLLALGFVPALWLAHRIQHEDPVPAPRAPARSIGHGMGVKQTPGALPGQLLPNATNPAASVGADSVNDEAAKLQLRKSGQYESLAAAIMAARYGVEKIDPAGPHSRGADYFAANPKQQLRVWFGTEGIEFASGIPTDQDKERWWLRLKLSNVVRSGEDPNTRAEKNGRESRDAWPFQSVERSISAEDSRVEITDSSNMVTEWYENRTEGIEHGFTLLRRPEGKAAEIRVVVRMEGNLHPAWSESVNGILFSSEDGEEILHYTGLKVWDATGCPLSARIDLQGPSLALVINDAGARYPITIDPLFASAEARFVDETSAAAGLGNSVALDGNRAVLGAPLDDTPAGTDVGSAYVFIRSVSTWSQEVKLSAATAMAGDRFGISVAVSGGTVVVGARAADLPGAIDAGCAYVFTSPSWEPQAKLTASDAASGDNFGVSVAVYSNTALIGANRCDTAAGSDAGAAYVFERVGTTWNPPTKLIAKLPPNTSDGATRDEFGGAVALHLNTAVIGARSDDHSGYTDAGSAYVFLRTNGVWAPSKSSLTVPLSRAISSAFR